MWTLNNRIYNNKKLYFRGVKDLEEMGKERVNVCSAAAK